MDYLILWKKKKDSWAKALQNHNQPIRDHLNNRRDAEYDLKMLKKKYPDSDFVLVLLKNSKEEKGAIHLDFDTCFKEELTPEQKTTLRDALRSLI